MLLNQILSNQFELMKKIGSATEKKPPPEIMTVFGLLDYLELKTGKKYSKATVYSWTFKQVIPFQKVNKKNLVFEKEQVDQWLLDGKTLSVMDQKSEFDQVMIKANAKKMNKMTKVN